MMLESGGSVAPGTRPADAAAALRVLPVTGIDEVHAGDDVATLLAGGVLGGLLDGDILVVTSKIISKAEGRVLMIEKAAAVAAETDRVVARRGPTSIVRTHHGLVMAGAGIDASNTEVGSVVLLPVDPDASARELRRSIAAVTGRNVAVVVTDTSGRAWRNGQTDIAIGAAGLEVLHDYAGRVDDYGNLLLVTAPAIADELAAAADLVKGKLTRSPAAVVRGLSALVLPGDEHGPGAAQLIRAEGTDMFGLGAREAVLTALRADHSDLRGFGDPCAGQELAAELGLLQPAAVVDTSHPEEVLVRLPQAPPRDLGATEARLTAAAFAMGWFRTAARHSPASQDGTSMRFRRGGP